MITYSNDSKRLISIFNTHRNHIDIYTEDKNEDKEFYVNIFRKLLDSSIQISDVYPLGNRTNVINTCKRDLDLSRKKIYIIDGDLTLINGKTENHENLYTLEVYSIENVLLDRKSVLEYIYRICCEKPKAELDDEIDFDNWLNTFCQPLLYLFFHFAILNKYDICYKLGHINMFFEFKNGNPVSIFTDKFDEYIYKLKSDILTKISEKDYNDILKTYEIKWEYTTENLLKLVAGKDYLFPIFHKKCIVYDVLDKFNLKKMKFNLVEHSELKMLESLKSRIENMFFII